MQFLQKEEITSLIEQLKKANLNIIRRNSSGTDQEINEELDEPKELISDISNEDDFDLNQIIDIEDWTIAIFLFLFYIYYFMNKDHSQTPFEN